MKNYLLKAAITNTIFTMANPRLAIIVIGPIVC
jgi:hypothetical protein